MPLPSVYGVSLVGIDLKTQQLTVGGAGTVTFTLPSTGSSVNVNVNITLADGSVVKTQVPGTFATVADQATTIVCSADPNNLLSQLVFTAFTQSTPRQLVGLCAVNGGFSGYIIGIGA